jgi:hypothetical protein
MIVSDLLKYERNMDVCKTLWGLLVKIKDIRKKKIFCMAVVVSKKFFHRVLCQKTKYRGDGQTL